MALYVDGEKEKFGSPNGPLGVMIPGAVVDRPGRTDKFSYLMACSKAAPPRNCPVEVADCLPPWKVPGPGYWTVEVEVA